MDPNDALDRDKVRRRVWEDTRYLKVAQIRQLAKYYGAAKVPQDRIKAAHALADAYLDRPKGSDLGRAPHLWWKGPIPRKVRACYPTKQTLLRLFVDENRDIIENYGGIDYQVSPAEFDAVNHKYDLTGKEAARSIADAVWAALPPQPRRKYCFEDIDIEALNDTSPAREAGISFRVPDAIEEQRLSADEARWYREYYGLDGKKAKVMLGIEPYQAKQLTKKFGKDWYRILHALDFEKGRSLAAVAKRAGVPKKRAETIMDDMILWEMADEIQRGRGWQYKLTDEGGREINRRRGLDGARHWWSPQRKRCYEKLDHCLRKANTMTAERKCNQQFRKCTRRR